MIELPALPDLAGDALAEHIAPLLVQALRWVRNGVEARVSPLARGHQAPSRAPSVPLVSLGWAASRIQPRLVRLPVQSWRPLSRMKSLPARSLTALPEEGNQISRVL
jgi:hypothetical protein